MRSDLQTKAAKTERTTSQQHADVQRAAARLKTEMFKSIVWFQKISRPPPRRELEIPGGWGGRRPRKFQKGGGLDNKITFQVVNIISIPTCVQTLLLTDLEDHF